MKKYFTILSSIVAAVILSFCITTKVNAAVKAYIVEDNGKIISFAYDDLIEDYTNKLLGKAAPMFDAYLEKAAGLVAFQDSVKGYVSCEAVFKAYQEALLIGQGSSFNIDSITENVSAADIKNITVGYEWKDGSLVVIDLPEVTVEQAGTDIPGKTVIVASLPATVDASQYSLSIDGQVMSYDASTKKFTITLDGTFTIQELQNKITVSLNGNNTSDDFDVEDIY